jgi:hypothetical protein
MRDEDSLIVEFFATPSKSSAWPGSVVAHSSYPLEDTKAAAKDKMQTLTWAVRFEISNREGRLLYSWPDKDKRNCPALALMTRT